MLALPQQRLELRSRSLRILEHELACTTRDIVLVGLLELLWFEKPLGVGLLGEEPLGLLRTTHSYTPFTLLIFQARSCQVVQIGPDENGWVLEPDLFLQLLQLVSFLLHCQLL